MAERLPNANEARIDPRKLRDYVLNTEHTIGKYKATFFVEMGYSADTGDDHLDHSTKP